MQQTTKERLAQFIAFQQISNRKFSEKISASPTYFTTTKSIGSDKLEKIHVVFPTLNMDWVITGRGEMLYKSNQHQQDMTSTELNERLERIGFTDFHYGLYTKSEIFKKGWSPEEITRQFNIPFREVFKSLEEKYFDKVFLEKCEDVLELKYSALMANLYESIFPNGDIDLNIIKLTPEQEFEIERMAKEYGITKAIKEPDTLEITNLQLNEPPGEYLKE